MLKKLMHSDELWIGEKKRILVDGIAIVLVHTKTGFAAFQDRCPHAGAKMSDGYLENEVLICERHHWQFNACTGKGINPTTMQLESYPLTIDAQGMIWVEMKGADMSDANAVGPVLIVSELTHHIINAIKKLNHQVEVQQHGSYFRVLVPEQCRLTKQAVEEQTGTALIFPDSLELVMPSFKGRFNCSPEEAVWSFKGNKE